MSNSPKKIYSLSGIPGVGKTTRGTELERVHGWKFYPEPVHEWPLDKFYAVKTQYEAGLATNEDMMDATNYLQLRIGISYLRLGAEIIAFQKENPNVEVVVERSPHDTTLFLRTNIIPDKLRPIQIEQYDALKEFMYAYNNIEPWCNVHHIFLMCSIPETVKRLLSRNETRISETYLQRLHDVHVDAFPLEHPDPELKSSTFIGDNSIYSVIDITNTDVQETCTLICGIHRTHGGSREI